MLALAALANAAIGDAVVARPTLVGLDRCRRTISMGSCSSLDWPGNVRRQQLYRDPDGDHLSVVPTFVDDDDLLLSVRASRSTFEEEIESLLDVGFENQILTARNAVTASVAMRMGETLILSGLTERELDRQSNRVPGLGDVPGANLAFNERITAETRTQSSSC